MTANKTIQHRKPIWEALSEFYLDTELEKADYDRIAAILSASGFQLHELKDIDLYEVFPVLKENGLSVAGVWTGFEEKWLIEKCTIAFQKRNKLLFQIKTKIYHLFLGGMTKNYWREIEQRM